MSKDIHIDDVPLTPGGVNKDYRLVRHYDFVKFDEEIKFRTRVLVHPDEYLSDNEKELIDCISEDERLETLLNSPMIEVRRRKSCPLMTKDGQVRLNPFRDDLLETSHGSLENYKENRRKTIEFIRKTPYSFTEENDENIEDKVAAKLDAELNLLVMAVSDSQVLLDNEGKRLSDMIIDWSTILQLEGKDMQEETYGDIESAIGRLKILMEKRYKSTAELLKNAENYVNNHGQKLSEGDQEYRAGDIYGFVDILNKEIKKVDIEFSNLLKIRDAHWVINTTPLRKAKVVLKRNEKNIPIKKEIKSRINVANLRSKFKKYVNAGTGFIEIFGDLPKTPIKTHNTPIPIKKTRKKTFGESSRDSSDENFFINRVIRQTSPILGDPYLPSTDLLQSVEETLNKYKDQTSKLQKTPLKRSITTINKEKLKKGIRSNSMLTSITGTPVHHDTPRPTKKRNVNNETSQFTVPTENIVPKKVISQRKSLRIKNTTPASTQKNITRKSSSTKNTK